MEVDYFYTGCKDDIDKLKGMKQGDICIQLNKGITYIYTGNKWEPITINKDEPETSYKDIECPSCGAHQFKRITDEFIECEFCGTKVYLKNT